MKIAKAKGKYKCAIKRKVRNSLEATQLENKINQLEKNKVNIDSLREKPKRIYKNQ